MKDLHRISWVVALVFAFCGVDLVAGDWPQWRGPTRDGVDPNSPKLCDAWPERGPKLVWKSTAKIPNGRQGGCGSVTVSGGKAFLYAHYNSLVKKVSITTEELKAWGWSEGVPESLTKPINGAAGALKKKFWGRTPSEADVKAHVDAFLKTLDPALAEKHGEAIHNYFKVRKVSWKGLRDLATVRDKEFDSIDALNRGIKYIGWGNIFHGHSSDRGPVKGHILAKCYKWTDKVFCFDAGTGKELWRKEFPGDAANKGTYYYAGSCTPSVANGKCYVACTGGFYCLNVEDGEVIWQAKTTYTNSSPLLLGDRVYVLASELMALDAASGKEVWRQPAVKHINNSISPWTSGGKTYLIAITRNRAIFCVNSEDGKVAWKTGFGKGANDCSPVISGDILVARGYGGMSAYKLTPQKATQLWRAKGRIGDRGSTPVIYKDHVYTTGSMYGLGSACCFDLKTGAMKWKHPFKKLESTSPIAVDGKIIAHVRNPKDKKKTATVMYKASGEKYEQLGILEEPAATFSSPVVAGGRMYLRLADTVACYELKAQ